MTFIPQKNEKYCFISCSEDKIKLGQCSCINNKQRKYMFMKILELDLKKKVLIVDIPRLADYEFINKECKYLKVGNEEIKLNASTLDKFEFLCKGSELTEEIASELVEEHYMSGVRSYEIYNDYRYNDARWLDNALESFISAVESKDKSIDINKCLIFIKK